MPDIGHQNDYSIEADNNPTTKVQKTGPQPRNGRSQTFSPRQVSIESWCRQSWLLL
jgi:hypothetical protein